MRNSPECQKDQVCHQTPSHIATPWLSQRQRVHTARLDDYGYRDRKYIVLCHGDPKSKVVSSWGIMEQVEKQLQLDTKTKSIREGCPQCEVNLQLEKVTSYTVENVSLL